ATEGIQRGHMTLHARSVALAAGANGAEIDGIAALMVEMGRVKIDVAQDLLAERKAG
ncbi:3-hydroxy-3-methylglutaryl-CoA reductase, partial [bacterium]|nr:3-hydroxy-3-methylglutaryl-CoA reductase [bacterium]